MPRDPQVYLDDILEAAKKIQTYVKGIDYDSFFRDSKTFDAVVRNLEIIGEATKKLDDDIKNTHPQIEWKKISGLRDILIHEYFGIDPEIVWDVVKNKIPELIKALQLDTI